MGLLMKAFKTIARRRGVTLGDAILLHLEASGQPFRSREYNKLREERAKGQPVNKDNVYEYRLDPKPKTATFKLGG